MEETDLDRQVLEMLEEHGPLTRDEMVQILKQPRTTIYDALKRQMVAGRVAKHPRPPNGKRGRPKMVFRRLK